MRPILTMLTLGLLAATAAQADTNDVGIIEVISQYESALNASSSDNILKLYGENSAFMPQHAPAQQGRIAIKQAYDKVFNTIKLDIKFNIHNVEILGDTAWARTSSAGTTIILANHVVLKEGNNELFIFKKENDDWKIHQYLFSSNQPRQ